MRDVVILGSTGSIGTQAVDVISPRQDQFRVVGLSAGGANVETLLEQIDLLRPSAVAVADENAAEQLRAQTRVRVLGGSMASAELAAFGADVVLNAISGAAGLAATMAALAAGSTLALANKESLVIGGPVVKRAAAPGQIVPVDSEHSALAQALRGGRADEVRRLILTASGGPFRGWTTVRLRNVTPSQALAHPTWSMGRVVTINSSTLVNKGLELIEAGLLFDIDLDDIAIVVHPQSIVHSMVEFYDGSTIAQCSPPDMRLPIALGLAWPARVEGSALPCDWSKASAWTFEPVDNEVFPVVELARAVGKVSGTAPAVFNAANEVAVDAFCDGRLGFPRITDLIRQVVEDHLGQFASKPQLSVSDVLMADAWARARAHSYVETWSVE
ncbi:MAG: 1-deoxy-D-xylulose-5-phosphate reductoisomerase [Propionibacteriaceae bacterium]|jgi:1-deoxy-D-xylulose-5-phosphate reductoisomerase|nr:1-deoxy-D-xylulose-5-phosphate reductoisomerase [Propionibacteriaceae bacterium]